MKERILKEITEYYKNKEQTEEIPDEVLKIIINTATDEIFERLKIDLKNEFETGNLQHPFFISDEYYIHLKLTDIKNGILSKVLSDEYNEMKEEK